ncbi:uncharacterized protein LOC117770658 [Hippoglossus hippoglossus]|uniref:uncharacterized protein LOC117770658 n=1 Tax=Hippoglossus hippoglossus TaxID=8267 RepID=UPI00148B7073|nr:uncharacterized protein LOC117770658 [Hippoglossus hippoglossus]
MENHQYFWLFLIINSCSGSGTGFNDDPAIDPRLYNLDWMKSVPDETLISALSIPGTHESLSLHGGPLAKCQVWTLDKQLNLGVRYFDLHVGICAASRLSRPKTLAQTLNKQLDNFVVQHEKSSSNQGCLGVLSMNFPSADLIKNIIQLKPCNCIQKQQLRQHLGCILYFHTPTLNLSQNQQHLSTFQSHHLSPTQQIKRNTYMILSQKSIIHNP